MFGVFLKVKLTCVVWRFEQIDRKSVLNNAIVWFGDFFYDTCILLWPVSTINMINGNCQSNIQFEKVMRSIIFYLGALKFIITADLVKNLEFKFLHINLENNYLLLWHEIEVQIMCNVNLKWSQSVDRDAVQTYNKKVDWKYIKYIRLMVTRKSTLILHSVYLIIFLGLTNTEFSQKVS